VSNIDNSSSFSDSINYDDPPISELEIEGVAYRIDTGLGSAVAISQRPVGTWTWQAVAEGRWDGSRLRAKELDYSVREALAKGLSQAMKDSDD
jgi:hypothetical protein